MEGPEEKKILGRKETACSRICESLNRFTRFSFPFSLSSVPILVDEEDVTDLYVGIRGDAEFIRLVEVPTST